MNISTKYLFDLSKSISSALLEKTEKPWEALSELSSYIVEVGKELDREKFYSPRENVWIAKSATVSESALICPPCIIDEGAEIRHCAFIRGSVIVGKNCVVGNSTELKGCILFDGVQVPHFNYIGDSIIGYRSHFGAGSVTSNVKSDKSKVAIKNSGTVIETHLKKLGAIVGDDVEIGCNAVLCPGTVLGRNVTVYPTSCVRGCVEENSIFKNDGRVEKKR